MSHWIHNLDPIAFHLGASAISWYWLFYPVNFALSLLLLRLWQSKSPYPWNDWLDYLVGTWFFGLLGARIFYIVFYNFEFFKENPRMVLQLWHGGMSIHGAFLGAILGVFILARKKTQNAWVVLDILAQILPLPLALGRLGNFINGELPGRVSQVAWAVIFPRIDENPRHPSQLYQALLEGIALFVILQFYKKRQEPKIGEMSAVFLIGYGTLRFIAEFFREPDLQLGYFFSLTLGQILCFIMIILGLLLYRQRRKI